LSGSTRADSLSRSPAGLLDGVTVIDLSMFVAGPFATMTLADLGARVIKVEPLAGDPVRRSGIGPQLRGEAAQFQSYNRNKFSIAVDLKADRGRAVILDLARHADAVFDNFRPGVLDRLGLGYEALRAVNPGIVSASLSAFGADGPWSTRPGYDIIVQALSGAMSLTGHVETGPARIPLHLGDTGGGLYAALALVAALVQRARTGEGCRLDLSLLDCQLALLGDEVTHVAATGAAPGPYGSGYPHLAPYAAYQTADRPIVVAAVGVEKFFANLAEAIGRPDLAADPRFRDNRARVANRAALDAVLAEAFRARPRDAWIETLIAHDVPAAPVLDVGEAIATPQARHRAMIQAVDLGGGETASVGRTPIRVSGAAPHVLDPAPALGADTRRVLQEVARYDVAAIDSLAADGIIG
jgi:CoA:oxalate CoA-transferase